MSFRWRIQTVSVVFKLMHDDPVGLYNGMEQRSREKDMRTVTGILSDFMS